MNGNLSRGGNILLRVAWLLAVLLLAPRLCAADQIVKFQFYKVVLSDGSAATGTFNYDYTTGKASAVNLTIGGVYFGDSATTINAQTIIGSYDTVNVSDELLFTFAAPLNLKTGAALSTNAAASYISIDPGVDTPVTLTVASGSVLPVAYLPITTASLAGTPNANGWFKSAVTVTLTVAAGAHPAAATYYTLDGGATTPYQSPFVVSGEAAHTLTYWSVDSAAFVEDTHSLPVAIDATPPVTTEYNRGETVSLYPTDAVSGVAATYYTLDGGATQTYTGPVIAPVGTSTITFWSVDVAGNSEVSQTATFTTGDTVAPSPPGSPYFIAPTTIVWLPSTDNVGVTRYGVQYFHGHSGRGGGYSWTTFATSTVPYIVIPANYVSYSLAVVAYDAAGNVSAGSGIARTLPPALPLTGTLSLEGVSDLSATAIPLDAVMVTFRLPGSTTPLFPAQTATLAPMGSQSPLGAFIVSMPPGLFDVAIKTAKNLQVVIPNVLISGPANTLPAVALLAGDANNDNSVDSTDFGILIGAFNTSINLPGNGYDPTTDFNDDGAVDSSDFGLLIGEYGNVGAP